MNEWAGEPACEEIEREFGVTVHRSGALSGTVGWLVARLPDGTQVRGEDEADLRDELIKHQRRDRLDESGPGGARTP